MTRPSAPLPDDGIYRAILMVLVASVIVGAGIALLGELVWLDKAVSHAGAWMVMICGGLYFVFRYLGRREMQRRDQRARDENGGDDRA